MYRYNNNKKYNQTFFFLSFKIILGLFFLLFAFKFHQQMKPYERIRINSIFIFYFFHHRTVIKASRDFHFQLNNIESIKFKRNETKTFSHTSIRLSCVKDQRMCVCVIVQLTRFFHCQLFLSVRASALPQNKKNKKNRNSLIK